MNRKPLRIVLALGLVSALAPLHVAGAPKGSTAVARSCRHAVARAFVKLSRIGFDELDACARRRARRGDGRDCSTLRPGTPVSTTYRRWEHRTQEIVTARCPLDSPARAPFPLHEFGEGLLAGDPALVIPSVGAVIEASAVDAGVSAASVVSAPAAAESCVAAVAAARGRVARETMRAAIRCQRRVDAAATAFAPLDPSCVLRPSDAVIREAAGRIAGACTGGPRVDGCTSGTSCAIDAATATGVELARLAFGQCGNGVLDGTEQCDDGNQDPDDGCDRCRAPVCGDGKVEGDEQCDDGNVLDHDGCTECRTSICGDGVLDVGVEACDDGNTIPLDGCTDCQSDPVACSDQGIVAVVTIDYDPDTFVPIAGLRLRLRYQPDVVGIPGSLVAASINQRVRNLTGLASGMSFGVADRNLLPTEAAADDRDDTLQTIAAISPGLIPPGPFESVRFDCLGAEARASQFTCLVQNVVDPFLNKIVSTFCDPDVDCGVTAADAHCSIELTTAPPP